MPGSPEELTSVTGSRLARKAKVAARRAGQGQKKRSRKAAGAAGGRKRSTKAASAAPGPDLADLAAVEADGAIEPVPGDLAAAADVEADVDADAQQPPSPAHQLPSPAQQQPSSPAHQPASPGQPPLQAATGLPHALPPAAAPPQSTLPPSGIAQALLNSLPPEQLLEVLAQLERQTTANAPQPSRADAPQPSRAGAQTLKRRRDTSPESPSYQPSVVEVQSDSCSSHKVRTDCTST